MKVRMYAVGIVASVLMMGGALLCASTSGGREVSQVSMADIVRPLADGIQAPRSQSRERHNLAREEYSSFFGQRDSFEFSRGGTGTGNTDLSFLTVDSSQLQEPSSSIGDFYEGCSGVVLSQ